VASGQSRETQTVAQLVFVRNAASTPLLDTVSIARNIGMVNTASPLGWVAMASGTVDFFNDTGGYGFIETEDADEDVFFHMDDIEGPDLEEGEEIEFEIEQAPKGPRANNVVRL